MDSIHDYKQKYMKYKMKYLQLKQSQIGSNNNLTGANNNLTGVNNNLTGGGDVPTLYLFKANWCGHCKNFKPTWEELTKIKSLNNKYINFVELDADTNKDKITEWNDTNGNPKVNGFPTLMLQVGNKITEYNNARDKASIMSFIKKEI